jgi:hypothetical protein
MDDFWFYRPESGSPPPPIAGPDEYGGSPNLNVVCTQIYGQTAYAQKKLVDAWCKALPGIDRIRTLWFSSRVPQRLFDAACSIPGLEGLYVKWSGIKSLAALEQAQGLRYLHLGSSTGVESIEPLGRMTQLRWLNIESFKKIARLDPLSNLTMLDGLSVHGSTWTTQRVETLAPIGALEQLRFLSLINLRSQDKTLRPLDPLTNLEAFRSSLWWPEDEVHQLHRNNPRLGNT